uniref:Uncharacterized protein n=1 Tax=OCS116 cluster bacterium TaxID=2030921 RepID=A0A2A4YZ69_9PROT
MKVVSYFVKEFFLKRNTGVGFFTSPSFVFKLDSQQDQTFEEFADRIDHITNNVDIEMEELTSDDDTIFHFKSVINISRDCGSNFLIYGSNTIFLKNGLISKVTIDHDLTEVELEYFLYLLGVNESDATLR